ncbi:TetR/AcrR family transcriptional regulator [Mycobacterium sp. RTGN5]|uniref:TetR/AcrR family transcriptional regulator n=1 Tax=Mycobacterium sp. RTGN5 TaxID=3016522 RepID=UPI0029C7FA08|nr:TetR family transcriptional regulator [Mycobacterium sp. RTGN5]
MTTVAADETAWAPTTRRRMLDTAIDLFSRYSFAGTSLQLIADELGLTKAAIYYHFRTREQLLLALMKPIFTEIAEVVEAAERRRGARARCDAMLAGYAGIVAAHRTLAAVTTFDPGVRDVLRNQPEWSGVIDRQLALLSGTDSAAGAINAAVVMTGLAGGAATAPLDIDDDTLRIQLIEAGRRILSLPDVSAPIAGGEPSRSPRSRPPK